ncbi:MAG: T9SS C-terminal target domain-containing protein, partial [Chlorobiota bacterium]
VYNVLGKEVATLANGEFESGRHSVDFNASDLASGVYYYTISAGNFSSTKKMILMK